MRNRIFQGMVLSGVILLAATGCAQKQQAAATVAPQSSSAVPTPVVPSPSPSPSPSPTPELKKSMVKVYYTDSNQIKLVEKEVTVSYKPDEAPYAATLEALKKSDDTSLASLFADITFKSIVFDKEKGDLKLDLGFGPNAQLGSSGEDYFLQALKKTVFQFPEVKTISVLKDGGQVESLMGHMDLPYPIKRAN
jgi:hypothetical protein